MNIDQLYLQNKLTKFILIQIARQRQIQIQIQIDSDIIDNIVDLIHKNGGGIQAQLYVLHKRNSYAGDRGQSVTDQGHITGKLMKQLQSLYGIALEKNVDQTAHQKAFLALVVALTLLQHRLLL